MLIQSTTLEKAAFASTPLLQNLNTLDNLILLTTYRSPQRVQRLDCNGATFNGVKLYPIHHKFKAGDLHQSGERLYVQFGHARFGHQDFAQVID